MPNLLQTLSLTYDGSSSLLCNQTVSIYNWTSGVWTDVDFRPASTTPISITAAPGGPLGDYVSGSTGTGGVAVRISCTAIFSGGNFFTSGDLLKIDYSS